LQTNSDIDFHQFRGQEGLHSTYGHFIKSHGQPIFQIHSAIHKIADNFKPRLPPHTTTTTRTSNSLIGFTSNLPTTKLGSTTQ